MRVNQNDEEQDLSSLVELSSRFGIIKYNPDKVISFPYGLLGLEGFKEFALTNFPNEKFSHFMILQSLEDLNLSFIVLPISNNFAFQYKNIIPNEKIEKICQELAVNLDNAVLLSIVAVDRTSEDEKATISVNAKAPIIINTANNRAIQYVINDDSFLVKHPISL